MGNYRTGTSNYRGGVKTFFSKQASDLIVNNSETYVNTDLVTPTLTIGKSYVIRAWCIVNSGTTPDFKFKNVVTDLVATSSLWTTSVIAFSYPTIALATEVVSTADGADQLLLITTSIINVTTAGSVRLQFTQNTATASATTFRKGSYWTVKEI